MKKRLAKAILTAFSAAPFILGAMILGTFYLGMFQKALYSPNPSSRGLAWTVLAIYLFLPCSVFIVCWLKDWAEKQ